MKREMPVSFAVCARYSVKRRSITIVNEGGTTELLRPLEDVRAFLFSTKSKKKRETGG